MSSIQTRKPPGFNVDADRGPYLYQLILAMLILSAICVPLRFLSRKAAKLPILWDDWLIVIAMVFSGVPTCAVMYRKSMQSLNDSS